MSNGRSAISAFALNPWLQPRRSIPWDAFAQSPVGATGSWNSAPVTLRPRRKPLGCFPTTSRGIQLELTTSWFTVENHEAANLSLPAPDLALLD
jgi:hypothetical protein